MSTSVARLAAVLTCGAQEPEQQDEEATIWPMSHRPLVEVDVPVDYRPEGIATALTQLAYVVRSELDEADACR